MYSDVKKISRVKKIGILLIVLCIMTASVACVKDEEEEGGSKNITVCLASEPGFLDPARSNSVDEAMMANHLFEGLTRWTDDGQGGSVLGGGMAESWDISEDGRKYVFHLRKDAKWSDGEPVVASDFIYAWKRLANPQTGAAHSYIFDMIEGWKQARKGEGKFSKTGIETVDDYTIKIALAYDSPFFLEMCAMPSSFPIRKDIVEKYGDQWSFRSESLICNGPYVLKSWVHNAYIQTEINEHYYDRESLGSDGIKFVLMDDDNAKITAYEKKELDFLLNPPGRKGKIINGNEQSYHGTQAICFNINKPPFEDIRVREAFALVIDRALIIDNNNEGTIAADAYIPPGFKGVTMDEDFRAEGGALYVADAASYAENCNRAKALLADAGYPDGLGFMPVEYICDRSEVHENIGKALRTIWGKELGISVSISSMDRNRFIQARKSKDYEIAYGDFIADYRDPAALLGLWVSDTGKNYMGYSNPRYDEIMAEAASIKDPAIRIPLLHEGESLLLKDYALVPLSFISFTYVKASDLKGVYNNPAGYFFFDHASK